MVHKKYFFEVETRFTGLGFDGFWILWKWNICMCILPQKGLHMYTNIVFLNILNSKTFIWYTYLYGIRQIKVKVKEKNKKKPFFDSLISLAADNY